MSAYFILTSYGGEEDLLARLSQISHLNAVHAQEARQAVAAAEVFFITQEGLASTPEGDDGTVAEVLLNGGAHLVVIPPLRKASQRSFLPGFDTPQISDASFGQVRVTDEELAAACGLNELAILYHQSLRAEKGRSVIETAHGGSVMIQYQHRSTWGQLVYTSLMIGSTSTRSDRTHRVALMQGLLSWLAACPAQGVARHEGAGPDGPDKDRTMRLVLLALYLAQQNGILDADRLKASMDQVRTQLGFPADEMRLDTVLTGLEARNLILPRMDSKWAIDLQRLMADIHDHRLGSYLRRIQ